MEKHYLRRHGLDIRRILDFVSEKLYYRLYTHTRFIQFQRELIESTERVVREIENRRSEKETQELYRDIDEFIRERIF